MSRPQVPLFSHLSQYEREGRSLRPLPRAQSTACGVGLRRPAPPQPERSTRTAPHTTHRTPRTAHRAPRTAPRDTYVPTALWPTPPLLLPAPGRWPRRDHRLERPRGAMLLAFQDVIRDFTCPPARRAAAPPSRRANKRPEPRLRRFSGVSLSWGLPQAADPVPGRLPPAVDADEQHHQGTNAPPAAACPRPHPGRPPPPAQPASALAPAAPDPPPSRPLSSCSARLLLAVAQAAGGPPAPHLPEDEVKQPSATPSTRTFTRGSSWLTRRSSYIHSASPRGTSPRLRAPSSSRRSSSPPTGTPRARRRARPPRRHRRHPRRHHRAHHRRHPPPPAVAAPNPPAPSRRPHPPSTPPPCVAAVKRRVPRHRGRRGSQVRGARR